MLVLRALDRRFLGAHLVVGGEARVVRLLEPLVRRVRVEPHRLELGLARRELASASRRSRRVQPLDLAGLELDPADELEVPVRRLVELQVLELVAVGDVALGLRGLALERAEVPLDLGDDVADAQQVLLRQLHLPLGLLLPRLELGDAGGLLDEQAPVFRLRARR